MSVNRSLNRSTSAKISRRTLMAGATALTLPWAASGCGRVADAPLQLDSNLYPIAEAEQLNARLTWPKSAVPDPDRKIRITVAHQGDVTILPRQLQFHRFFMERHPTIEVVTEATPGDYLQKYTVQAAGGTLPDVMWTGFSWAQFFIKSGMFYPLDNYIEREPAFDLHDFTPPSLGYYQRDNQLYALAYDCGPVMLFYNKQLFDKAHVPYPNSSWTVDDFLAAAGELTRGQGGSRVYGFSQVPDISNETAPAAGFLRPFGEQFLDGAETECLLDRAGAIDALRKWTSALRPAAPSLADSQALKAGPFLLGRAAMSYEGYWMAPVLYDQGKFPWAVADWPRGPERRSTVAIGSAYAITADSAQKDAAWIYLQEYTSTAGLTFIYSSTGRGGPSRWSAWPAYVQSDYAPEGAELIQAAMRTYASSEGVLHQPTSHRVFDAARPVWDELRNGSRDVQSACDEVQRRVQPILMENAR